MSRQYPGAESPLERDAYRRYLAMGRDRSLERVVEDLAREWQASGKEKPPALRSVARWSAKYHWGQRVTEDDKLIEAKADQKMRDRLAGERDRLSTERTRRKGNRQAAADILLAGSIKALVTPENQPKDFMTLEPRHLGALTNSIKVGSLLGRLEDGEPTDHTEHTGLPEVQQTVVLGREALTELFYFFADPETAREADIAEEMAQAARQQQLLPNQPVIEGELTGDLD